LKNGNLNFEPHKETEHPIKVVMSDTSCFAQYKEEVMDLLKRMSMVSVGTMEVVRGWRMHSASWRWQGHISAHEHRVRLQDAAHTAQDQLADHLPRTLLQTDSKQRDQVRDLDRCAKDMSGITSVHLNVVDFQLFTIFLFFA